MTESIQMEIKYHTFLTWVIQMKTKAFIHSFVQLTNTEYLLVPANVLALKTQWRKRHRRFLPFELTVWEGEARQRTDRINKEISGSNKMKIKPSHVLEILIQIRGQGWILWGGVTFNKKWKWQEGARKAKIGRWDCSRQKEQVWRT